MRGLLLAAVLILFIIACADKNKSRVEKILVDKVRLDSIRQHSDTGYERNVGSKEFYTAEQYLNKKDSIISKIMKDEKGNVTGFVQFRNNLRLAYAEYYPNGQLKGSLPLDGEGRFSGPSKYYYEDGRIKSEGVYKEGFFSGQWRNYDEEGKLVSIDEYDKDGQLIKSNKMN